jgi:hypothetical protein
MRSEARYPVVHRHLPAACRLRRITQKGLVQRIGCSWGFWRGLLQGRLLADEALAAAIAQELGLPVSAIPRRIVPQVVVPAWLKDAA